MIARKMRQHLAPWILALPALVGCAVFFATPMVYVVIESFAQFSLTGAPGGITLDNYRKVLADPYYLAVLANTFRLAAITAVLCLVIAYPLALLLRAAPSRFKGLLLIGILAPLLVSVIVRTFGWIVVLGEFGLVNKALRFLGMGGDFAARTHLFSDAAVITGLVHILIPFMVLALYSALQKQESRLVDAARNLGASPLRAFLSVTLPLSLPGVVAGMTTVFAMAAGAYVTVAVLGGAKVMVLSILAYQQSLGMMNWQLGGALGVVLLVSTTALMALFQLIMRRRFPRTLDA